MSQKDSDLARITSLLKTESKEREFVISELKSVHLESQRLQNENNKLLAQITHQETFLNNKINILLTEKDNLEKTVRQFTKSNTILDKMVFNSKESFNREGLGYNAYSPPKRELQIPKASKDTSPKSSSPKCENSKKNNVTKVAQKKANIVKNDKKQPKVHFHQKLIGFQQRNVKNQASTSSNYTRHLNVPKQGYNARNPNGYGYARNLNANAMPRNTSYVNGRSGHYANVSRHTYPRNNNAYVRNNVNYHANDHSRDSIITIFPRSDNNHAYRGNSKYMPRRNPYHISNRNLAFRNDIIFVNDYPMPRFVYENSHLPYNVLTPRPSSKKGTKRFN
ncbi:hypothetical protein POM88_041268 [Heracleum sosnowskyi]|uniref:Uncharacterized protein n=1 Tax=Heracleum sosnowskyi TaxID=360622 RepID=A0AAD8HDW5_9APIA|nr:hypothetical protein POM88_041268 [Heracleum sosnowskyi]